MTWNNRPGSGAKSVVDAFLGRRPKRKGNFESTGDEYRIYGEPIVKHFPVEAPEAVAHQLLTDTPLVKLAYRFPTHPNVNIVHNHLRLFEVWVYQHGEKPVMDGVSIEPEVWYTREQLDAMPEALPAEPAVTPVANARRDTCTADLFE